MIGARTVKVAVVLATLALAGCGGGGGGPTSPSPSATDVQGVWEGTWVKSGCSETGGASGSACNATPQSGGFRVTLTQTDSAVQGSVEVGAFLVPATGSVSGNNVTLTGQSHRTVDGQGVTGSLQNWTTARSGNGMSGSFTLRIVWDDPSFGTQTLQLTLQNVNKTA
jgi:hypothetical protein